MIIEKQNRKQNLLSLSNVKTSFIIHTQMRNIIDLVSEVIETKALSRTEGIAIVAESICLTGDSGTGKTYICDYIAHHYPSKTVLDEMAVIEKHPVLSISVANRQIKGLASRMLEALGDPNPTRGSESEMTHRVQKLLITCETDLIILDEFNNLINDKNAKSVLYWVKSLMNHTNIPVLVVGTPEVKGLVNSNPEMARRFLKVNLMPFDFDLVEQHKALPAYINAIRSNIIKRIAFQAFPEFRSTYDLLRLYLATLGYPTNLSELIINAAKSAIRASQEVVTVDDFVGVYTKSRLVHVGEYHSKNPFTLNEREAVQLFNSVLNKQKRIHAN